MGLLRKHRAGGFPQEPVFCGPLTVSFSRGMFLTNGGPHGKFVGVFSSVARNMDEGLTMGKVMERSEFERDVREALDGLPLMLRSKLENIAVVVEDLPAREVVEEMGLRSPYDLLGLYQGVALDRRGFYYGNVLPDKITLFRRSIEAQCKSREEMVAKIQEVVLHEIGHYYGLDDRQLRALLSAGDRTEGNSGSAV